MRYASCASAVNSDAVTSIHTVLPGHCLKDRYEVLTHIGSGGMADVFHAWDQLFHRDVAIKVLKLERIDEAMKKRVLREARASCAVDHPHMLRVTDMGFVGEAPFLVSDLLRGNSLADELRRAPGGRLEWRRVVRWLLPAMEALHRAHEAGLIHRDIKPENLFLHRRGDSDVLMVLDLGFVKFTDDAGKGLRWTRTGVIVGTAMYMSPEQTGGPIDRRSDVYSMGVTLHRLLSGQHLFPPSTGDGPVSAMTKHIYEPPPRLREPGLPPALVEAVLKAVAKDPEQRHPTMARFAAVLSACLDEQPRWTTARRILHGMSHVGIGAVAALVIQRAVTDDVAGGQGTAPTSGAAVEAAPVAAAEFAELCSPDPLATSLDEAVADEPVPAPDPPVQPRASQRPRTAPASAGLARAGGAVHRCMQVHGDPDATRLAVRVTVAADGRVASVAIPGGASFLTDCVREQLAALRLGPGPRRTLEHTYRFSSPEKSP